ncbi:MAG: 30S ribosomal protein S16, partial [Flavobacteriaceae bacterium]|nr:30S ribosomal protein S16 [Flavobacteriaceae bacterium]
MPTKIRLQRHGRKAKPIFKIVVADSRAKRDGKFIENLGQYNPNTNPASIELNFDRALDWVIKGAQPTNTALALLKYKGVMMKKHLLGGVAKGAFSEEEADKRFEAWLSEKEDKINAKRDNLSKAEQETAKARLAAEKEISDARAQELANANAALASEAEAVSEEAPATEEAPAAEEAPATEEASAAEEA